MLQIEQVKRLTMVINACLLGFVILLAAFYWSQDAMIMFYYSIPTAVAYVLYFYLIYKKWLDIYLWLLYLTLTLYMVVTTVCFGYNFGFHLYSSSMIPLIFYMEYFAHQLHTRRPHAMLISLVIVAANLSSTIYVVLNGPIYLLDTQTACFVMVINAGSVFFLLISYASSMHHLILASEARLSDLAHTDQLTGLFNRHYMVTHLEQLDSHLYRGNWIAMVDIDDFKSINDHYGHGGGDYVLTELSRIMRDVCKECVIARWGGEEFLITPGANRLDHTLLEMLRQTVEHTQFLYGGQTIAVTITIGMAQHQAGQSLESWIRSADNKLYEGKQHGKNRVIY